MNHALSHVTELDLSVVHLAGMRHSEWMKARMMAAYLTLLAPPDHPTKGSVVVRYRGRQPGRPVLFLGHLDVVEVKPEDWSVELMRQGTRID